MPLPDKTMTATSKKRKNHTVKQKGKHQNGKVTSTETVEDDFWNDETSAQTPWISLHQAALLCSVVGFLLYINTIWTCGFCYDDAVAIIANPDVLSSQKELAPSSSLFQVFEHDYWGLPVTDVRSHKSYRPIAILSLRMDAYVARLLGVPGEPAVFHFFNALLYAVTCGLLIKYMLAPLITSTPFQQQKNVEMSVLLSGLWFVTHPVHTESVAALVGRADILAALFSILGTKFHFQGRIMPCAVCFMTACLCKETSVMIPMVLVVAGVLQMVLSSNKTNRQQNASLLSAAPILVAISLGYVQFRSWLFVENQTLFADSVNLTDNFVLHTAGVTKLRSALYIQAQYLWLLLFPNKLSCDYSLGVINPVTTWWCMEMAQVTIAILIVMIWARFAMVRLQRTGNVVPLLALGWTIAPLIPASHIVEIGTVMAERLLFLPSMGVPLLLCHILTTTTARQSQLAFLLVVCIALFSFKTITRNPNWADTKALFKADLETYPKSLKALITNIRSDVDDDIATRYSERAEAILKEHEDIFSEELVENTRATILLRMADMKMKSSSASEALLYADNLIHRHQETGNVLNVKAHAKKARSLLMLGIEQEDASLLQDAVEAYKRATRAGQVVDDLYWFDIQEGKARAYYSLWRLSRDKAMLLEAVNAFRTVVLMGDVYGDNDERWMDILLTAGKSLFRLGVSTGNQGLFREALGVYRQAVTFGNAQKDSRHWADVHEELGKTLLQLGPAMRIKDMIEEAEAAFRVSIEYGDTDDNLYIFCMHGTALAMLNQDIKAHEEFQNCFSRERHALMAYDENNSILWEDQFGYRKNYAILMQKLSGVRERNHAAMRKWGRPALDAIDTMLTMAKENELRIMLSPDKVQEWIIVMNAIREQLDIDQHSEL